MNKLLKNNMLNEILNHLIMALELIKDNKILDGEQQLKIVVDICSKLSTDDLSINPAHLHSIQSTENFNKEKTKQYIYTHFQLLMKDIIGGLLMLDKMLVLEDTESYIESAISKFKTRTDISCKTDKK